MFVAVAAISNISVRQKCKLFGAAASGIKDKLEFPTEKKLSESLLCCVRNLCINNGKSTICLNPLRLDWR